MTKIEICVIGFKTKEFVEHLTAIRQIDGLKVLKRRNKPFYDITGQLTTEGQFKTMGAELRYLFNNCDAQLEINDNALRERIFDIL